MTPLHPPTRPRVLIAVEPAVVEGALAVLLEAAEDIEVVLLHQTSGDLLGEQFDVAVTSIELPSEVRSALVITLDDECVIGEAAGHATERGGGQIELDSYDDVIDLVTAELDRGRGAP